MVTSNDDSNLILSLVALYPSRLLMPQQFKPQVIIWCLSSSLPHLATAIPQRPFLFLHCQKFPQIPWCSSFPSPGTSTPSVAIWEPDNVL